MNWLLLVVAGLFEAGFATCLGKMRESTGTAALAWGVGFLACLAVSMVLLFKASQQLPIGTAYAVWTGVGAVCTVVAGILLFKEPATFWRVFFLATLVGSLIGLRAVSH
jgi:quaternary ammonium compound-resistance protein SugE